MEDPKTGERVLLQTSERLPLQQIEYTRKEVLRHFFLTVPRSRSWKMRMTGKRRSWTRSAA